MNKQRLNILTWSLGLAALGELIPAQALPSYTPLILDNPTPQARAEFGSKVAGIGDVSGDGVPDVVVGALFQTANGNREQGRAFVLSGATGETLYILDHPRPQKFAHFGAAVAGIGDVSGDGTPDLLVSARGQDVGDNQQQGQAFVFNGADGKLLYILNNPTPWPGAIFGWSVAGAGDVNGDEVPDILVGAHFQYVNNNFAQGRAFVFNGATGGLLHILNNPRPQSEAFFGEAVAGVGDVNGDGVSDLLVGAPSQDVGGNDGQGQAFVFSGATGQRLYTLNNPMPQADANFGWSVAGPGDVNGDSTPDLLVGAFYQTVDGNFAQGQAFVFSGVDGSLVHTLDNPRPQELAFFGGSVAGAGDVNGDGRADLLVGAYLQNVGGNSGQGQAFVFSGANGRQILTLNNPKPQKSALFGEAVAGVGDVNGDDTPDFLVGASGQDVGGNDFQGRAFLFVSGPATPRWVAMNILPKQINLKTQDVLPVAILTTPRFNAAQVDPLSVRLGPGKAREIHRQGHFRDVDGDGDRDLVLHFKTQAVGLGCGEQAVKLSGQTGAGQPIRAVDRLTVVGCQ